MRDPQRIERILEKLKTLWHRSPDLRLGQLVENAKMASRHCKIDTFSAEDDELEKGLDWLLEHIK